MIHVTNHWRWRQQKYYDCSEARFLKQSNVLYEFEGIQKCRLVQLSVAIMWTLLWGTTRRMCMERVMSRAHTRRGRQVWGKMRTSRRAALLPSQPCSLRPGPRFINHLLPLCPELPSIRPPDPSFRQQIRALLDRTSLKPYLSVGVPLQQSAQRYKDWRFALEKDWKRGVWNGDTGGSRV